MKTKKANRKKKHSNRLTKTNKQIIFLTSPFFLSLIDRLINKKILKLEKKRFLFNYLFLTFLSIYFIENKKSFFNFI